MTDKFSRATERVESSFVWKDTFGLASWTCVVVSAILFAYMATHAAFGQEGTVLRFGISGGLGFVCGLIGTVRSALQHRAAMISISGMLISAIPAGLVIMGYAGAFRM